MEKVKHLPISKKVLVLRIFNIQERIDKCEEGIPPKFWCDDCKQLLAKIDNLKAKIKNIDLVERTPPGIYIGLWNSGDGSFSTPTPTFKYICSGCGYTLVINEQLCPPLGTYFDSNTKLRCATCGGLINDIEI